MVQIVVFVLALVAIFAINAAVALRTRDAIVANSTSFSWMGITQEDVDIAAQACEEQERAARPVTRSMRRTASASI